MEIIQATVRKYSQPTVSGMTIVVRLEQPLNALFRIPSCIIEVHEHTAGERCAIVSNTQSASSAAKLCWSSECATLYINGSCDVASVKG